MQYLSSGAWLVSLSIMSSSFIYVVASGRISFFFLRLNAEGNGNPLQCSCLENPRDGGAWWAAICGVAQSRTRLKWLSSSSSSMYACSIAQRCLSLCDPMDCSLPGSSVYGILQGRTGVGCYFLLHGIAPTQGKLVASALQADSLPLICWGSPTAEYCSLINTSLSPSFIHPSISERHIFSIQSSERGCFLTIGHQFHHQHWVSIVGAADFNSTVLHTFWRYNTGHLLWGGGADSEKWVQWVGPNR